MISRFLALVLFVVLASEAVFATSLPRTMAPRHSPKKKNNNSEEDHYVGSPAFPLNTSNEMKKKIQREAVEKLAANPDKLNKQDKKALVYENSPLNETHHHALYEMDPLASLDHF